MIIKALGSVCYGGEKQIRADVKGNLIGNGIQPSDEFNQARDSYLVATSPSN
jgi:hypothetical protein